MHSVYSSVSPSLSFSVSEVVALKSGQARGQTRRSGQPQPVASEVHGPGRYLPGSVVILLLVPPSLNLKAQLEGLSQIVPHIQPERWALYTADAPIMINQTLAWST